jgi:transketolase
MKGIEADLAALELKARQVRATCIQMAHDGKENHLNGALSVTDLLVALYHGWLRIDPRDPRAPGRDRLIFSKGHACTALYAVLADRGFFPVNWLSTYACEHSHLPSHPCTHALSSLEWSSGSLGHGLGVATGMCYGLMLDRREARVVAILSDGECNEGSTWEAAMFAAANGLDKLLAIVDYNGIQSVGRTDELNGFTSFEHKFRAFGWSARSVDGHNIGDVLETLHDVPFEKGKPSVIIAKTRAGKGVGFMEDQVLWHYRTPSDEELERAIRELGVAPLQQNNEVPA